MIGLGLQSLWNRRFVAALTIAAIALSVALILSVERLRDAARSSFANSASGVDLIVAPRGNDVQILMATVFGVGSTGTGMDFDVLDMIQDRPEVSWAVPIMQGDNHRGFPVIGTEADYFEHYKHSGGVALTFAEGHVFDSADTAVIGAEVAARFGYDVGTEIVNAHGAGDIALDVHDDAPFVISGVLNRTNTAVDRMVYVSIEGFDAIHAEDGHGFQDPLANLAKDHSHDTQDHDTPERDTHDHEAAHSEHDHGDHEGEDVGHREDEHEHVENDHAHEAHEQPETDHDAHHGHHDRAHAPDQINAIYVGLSNRTSVLSMQRAVADYGAEALSAVMPNVALLQLWSITGTAENALRLMSIAVVVASMIGMVVMLSATLENRRREFAILRSVGAAPRDVFGLIVAEALVVSAIGIVFGFVLFIGGTFAADPVLTARFGVSLTGSMLEMRDVTLMFTVFCIGGLASLLPALRVYRMTLADGLTTRL